VAVTVTQKQIRHTH